MRYHTKWNEKQPIKKFIVYNFIFGNNNLSNLLYHVQKPNEFLKFLKFIHDWIKIEYAFLIKELSWRLNSLVESEQLIESLHFRYKLFQEISPSFNFNYLLSHYCSNFMTALLQNRHRKDDGDKWSLKQNIICTLAIWRI